MRLDSKLSKLELKARKTLKCDWCRFILVDTPPSQVSTIAANNLDYPKTTCPWCGTSYSLNLTGLTEYQREALLISYNKHDGEVYTDKRVAAADTWFHASLVVASWKGAKLQRQFEREERKVNSTQTYLQQREAEKRKAAQAATPHAKIKAKAYAFLRKMMRQEEKLYSPAKHDLQDEIKALSHLEVSIIGYAPKPHSFVKMCAKEKAIRTVIYKASVMEVCERVIWGKTLPVTAEILKHANNLAQTFVEERDKKKREEEEEKRLREEERERERAEREAARLARTQPPQAAVETPEPSIQESPFWNTSDDTLTEHPAFSSVRMPRTNAPDSKGRVPVSIPLIPGVGEASNIPPDDGSDPYYKARLAYYREWRIWPDNKRLGVHDDRY